MQKAVFSFFILIIGFASAEANDFIPFTGVSCSSDGKYYAGVHQTNHLFVRDIDDGKVVKHFQIDSKDIYSKPGRLFSAGRRFLSLDFKPSSYNLMVGTNSTKGILWDMEQQDPVSEISNFPSAYTYTELKYSQDGKFLVSVVNNVFKVYDADTQKLIYEKKGKEIKNRPYHYTSLAINSSYDILAMGGTRYLHFYNLSDGSLKSVIEYNETIFDVEFSHDGKMLAFQHGYGIGLWNVQTNKLEQTIELPKGEKDGLVYSIFSRDDSILYVSAVSHGGNIGSLRSYDLKNKKWLSKTETPGGSIRALAMCGKQYLITGHWENTINVIDLISGEVVRTHVYTDKIEEKVFGDD